LNFGLAHVGPYPVCEKWRSIANSPGWRRLDAAGFNRHEPWQIAFLRSSNVASEHTNPIVAVA
jgi:hypothetical protein